MTSIVYLGVLAFVVCFVTTPLVRNLTRKLGFLDHPDRQRKFHPTPVPRLGGVAIAFSWVTALGVFAYFVPAQSTVLLSALDKISMILPAAALIFAIGVFDDLYELRPWQKLAGQLVAATWIYVLGLRIEVIAFTEIPGSHWVTFPLTVLWLLACTNAFNLIDGVDGLASGVGFFATVTMFLAALLAESAELQLLTLPLAAALLAFLRYNFNPASIFLGDSGSLLIGFLLGSFAIIWTQKSATILGMTAPVLALGFPIAETVISIGRRFLRGAPIFGADQGHIHHRLLEKGLRPRQVAVVLYATAGLFASVSLIMAQPEIRDRAIILVAFCVISWIGFQNLGYTEFISARRILLGGTVRRLVASDIRTRQFTAALESTESLEEAWKLAIKALAELGFSRASLDVNGSPMSPAISWSERLGDASESEATSWSLRIPIPDPASEFVIERGVGSAGMDQGLDQIVTSLRAAFPALIENYQDSQVLSRLRPKARAAGVGGR